MAGVTIITIPPNLDRTSMELQVPNGQVSRIGVGEIDFLRVEVSQSGRRATLAHGAEVINARRDRDNGCYS